MIHSYMIHSYPIYYKERSLLLLVIFSILFYNYILGNNLTFIICNFINYLTIVNWEITYKNHQ